MFCGYHGIKCDYKGNCIDCPHTLNQRWIPVGERLPDDGTVVFYTDNKGETGMVCYWEDLPQEFEDIIAWMPLPEPYKEEER